jgi:hypothetical protein
VFHQDAQWKFEAPQAANESDAAAADDATAQVAANG